MPGGRRWFLRSGARVLAAAALPPLLTRIARAAEPRRKQLVVIFLRGAADALNALVPFADPWYLEHRPSLALPRGSIVELDGTFGFHPALSPLMPLWRQGYLAAVAAAGSPDPTRSHFEAQDFMESGTPGVRATPDGWLNRCAQSLPQP